MESVVQRYRQLQDDLFAALAEEVGPRDWKVSANSLGGGRSGCADDPEGEEVQLPPMSAKGVYPSDRWGQVRSLVERVGRDHGFDDVAVVKDRPGDLVMFGEDRWGGRYQFGMATNTVFDVRTGCHRWKSTPPASP
jgi:hypothetical protein